VEFKPSNPPESCPTQPCVVNATASFNLLGRLQPCHCCARVIASDRLNGPQLQPVVILPPSFPTLSTAYGSDLSEWCFSTGRPTVGSVRLLIYALPNLCVELFCAFLNALLVPFRFLFFII
jgi:hypothetical protein